ESVTLPSGGRGFDQDRDGIIGPHEGATATAPRRLLGRGDSERQTVVDWMQLVRVIQAGMDVDGDGAADLDPARISYLGGSLEAGSVRNCWRLSPASEWEYSMSLAGERRGST